MQIVGKGFSIPEFKDYVDKITFNSWKPLFPVIHNTSVPSQALYKSWHLKKGWSGEQWLKNLASYYSGLGWNGCPHLFVAYDKIWVANPLNVRGTHTPSWNKISWGIETVAEFETEFFIDGVNYNLIAATAILCAKMNFNPAHFELGKSGIHFHKEDEATTHKTCPGKNLIKSAFVGDVIDYMNDNLGFQFVYQAEGSHPHISEASQTADTSGMSNEELTSIKWVQVQLKRLGADVIADGIVGKKTKDAVKAFQKKNWLHIDGIAGPLTRKALKTAK